MVIMIDLAIKVLDLQNLKVKVHVTTSVYELKEYIASKFSIAVHQQEIILRGYILNNETKFADIDIDGKVLQLVKKIAPLSTTITTINNAADTDFRGRNHVELNCSRSIEGCCDINLEVKKAFDMIRKSNEILYRMENLFDIKSRNNQLELPMSLQQSYSSNTNYEKNKIPNISTNGTLRTRFSSKSRNYAQSQPHSINSSQQFITNDPIEGKANNNFTDRQMSRTSPSTKTSKQYARNCCRTPETMLDVSYRSRLSKLFEQLNRLNIRFKPFYAQYCRHIYEHYQLGITETGTLSFQTFIILNSTSKVMHYISEVYKTISYFKLDMDSGGIFYYNELGTLTEIPQYLSGIQLAASSPTNSRKSNITDDHVLDNSVTFNNLTAEISTNTSPNGKKSITVQQPENDQHTIEYDVFQNKTQSENPADKTSPIYSNIQPSNNLTKKLENLTIKSRPNSDRFKTHTLRTYV